MDYQTDIKKFLYSHYFFSGTRQAVGVVLPALVLFWGMDQHLLGIEVASGALCASVVDINGPLRHKHTELLSCTLLGALTVLLALTLVLAVTSMAPKWLPMISAVLVSAFLVATVATAPARKQTQFARPAPVQMAQARRAPAPLAAPVQQEDDWESWNAWDDDSSWEAVPSTLPTYVNSPRASVIPRPIDRSRPGAMEIVENILIAVRQSGDTGRTVDFPYFVILERLPGRTRRQRQRPVVEFQRLRPIDPFERQYRGRTDHRHPGDSQRIRDDGAMHGFRDHQMSGAQTLDDVLYRPMRVDIGHSQVRADFRPEAVSHRIIVRHESDFAVFARRRLEARRRRD